MAGSPGGRLSSRKRSTGRKRPFAAYYRAWLDTHARVYCKPGTIAGYEAAGRLYLIPFFGRTDIRRITRADVRTLVRETLLPGHAFATVRANVAPLRAMLAQAVADGLLDTNPAADVLRHARGVRPPRRAPRFLERRELVRLLAACRALEARWYPFVLVLARTGMRLGEAAALRWADVDLEQGLVEVRRAFWRGRVQTPKTGRGRRVDLSRQLVATLRVVHAEQVVAGGGRRPEWVFASARGVAPNTDNFRRRAWRRIVRAAGLEHVWPHCLRHTFASLLLANGESLAYVKEQLGHRSIQTTVDTYGHLAIKRNRAAVDRLDDA